ncbi:MAG: serine/threonine-protein kinase, partial [Candidatus Competibacterales bacterium]|nr:serine/threonine-protein kinase [Candidatus Competibacterales bacterium]
MNEASVDDTFIQIPGYRLEHRLGSGAMATVYSAVQKTLERRVALKLMADSLTTDPVFQKRFLKEGQIVAQLNHPNIVTIHDIGLAGSNYYMAMEYLSGVTLRERIDAGMTADEAVTIVKALAGALGYAHRRNFVHRDVKPANIMFREDGTPVLTDFGIAKALADSTQMTQAGWTVGTPSYMSPEQALGKPVDGRCDLYSLGVVFFEMLTGSKPYQGSDSFAVALMHVNDAIPRLPPELQRFQPIIDKLMAKQPEDRYPDADALIEALQPLLPRAKRVEPDAVVHGGRRGWLWALSSITAVLGVAGYLVYAGLLPLPWLQEPADPFGLGPIVARDLTPEQREQVSRMLEVA